MQSSGEVGCSALSKVVHTVNEEMIEDLRLAKYGEHASNLGAILANELSLESGKGIPYI